MAQEANTSYSGTHSRSVDAKKRVAVPADLLRQDEGEVFHIIPHPTGGFLMVMPPAEFDRWEQRIQNAAGTPAEKRHAIRKFYSEAHTVSTDRQGRILLSEKHYQRAGVTGEVVFVGVGSRFEIWSKERHSATDAEATEPYQRIAEAIGL